MSGPLIASDSYWQRTARNFVGKQVCVRWNSPRAGEGETTGLLHRVEETRLVVGDNLAVRYAMIESIEELT